MTRTIYVPEGEAGDEAIKRIIPHLWRMSHGEAEDADGTP